MPPLALVLLALRRALPLALFLALLLLLVLAARASGGDGALGAEPASELAQALGRAWRRQDVWSVVFLIAAPALVWQAAHAGTPRAAEWLLATPARRSTLVLASCGGSALAALLVAALAALVGESALASAGQAWRRAALAENPPRLLIEAEPAVRWELADCPRGARLRLWTSVAPGSGPAVTAEFSARAGDEQRTVRARVSGRAALELEAPNGSSAGAPLALELARVGPGAVLVLPPHALEVLVPAASERLSALELALRTLLLAWPACALAAGLGGWMRPALAALVVLALALVGLGSGAAFSPAGDLAAVWEELSTGLVPAHPSAASAGLALAWIFLGLVLQERALALGRRDA